MRKLLSLPLSLDAGTLRVVLLYFLLAGTWIFVSDSILSHFYADHPPQGLQTIKGLLFVVITSLVLYRLVRGYWHSLEEQGRIEARSSVGRGSLFHFTISLPRAVQPVNKKSARPLGLAVPERTTVLHAEDEATNRLLVRHLLEREGLRVLEACDGQEALDLLASEHVDMVLMDIQMPRMDGLEALSRIRSGQAGNAPRDLPVVAVTAYALEEDRSNIMNAGMTGFLPKPFGREELLRSVREALKSRTMSQS